MLLKDVLDQKLKITIRQEEQMDIQEKIKRNIYSYLKKRNKSLDGLLFKNPENFFKVHDHLEPYHDNIELVVLHEGSDVSKFFNWAYRCNDEIESTVVTKGTIQIPRDGNPIILMSDSQSTGGYPILGNICKVDISKISQIKPNKCIRFKIISLNESNRILEYEQKKFKSKLSIDLSA